MATTIGMCWIMIILALYTGLYNVDGNKTKYVLPRDARVDAIKHATRWYRDHGKMSRYSRPVSGENGRTTVAYTVKLMQLLELDVKSQLFTGKFWQNYEWMDNRVAWDLEDFDNISQIQLPHGESIWAPDVMLYNEYDVKQSENFYDNIHNTGRITWIPSTIYTVPCTMDITYFPFDTHTCDLTFASWKLGNDELNLTYDSFVEFGGNHNWQNAEWELHHEQVRVSEKEYPIGNWTLIHYELTFKRRVAFFTYVLVLPSILMSLLTLLVFWLPPESEEKISIGLSLFLTYFVLLMIVVDATPKSGFSIPLLGEYLFVCIALIALSIFACALVFNLAMREEFCSCFQGTNKKVLLFLAKIFLISTKKFNMQHCRSDDVSKINDIPTQVDISHMTQPNDSQEIPGDRKRGSLLFNVPPNKCMRKQSRKNIFTEDFSTVLREDWKLLAKIIQRSIFLVFFIINLVVLLSIFSKFWMNE